MSKLYSPHVQLPARTPQSTPVDKITHLLEKYRNSVPSHVQRCVLLSTGSYNPCHQMHIKTFQIIKKALESSYGKLVVGAFISPSHGQYVSGKLRDDYIETEARLEICKLSIDSETNKLKEMYGEENADDFLSVDRWESAVCCEFIDFPDITFSLREYIEQQFPNENIQIIYICGSDHIEKCPYVLSFPTRLKCGAAILNRPSHSKSAASKQSSYKATEHIYWVDTTMEDECSSTLVRNKAKLGESISQWVYPEVESYMRTHHIYFP
ncbi:hypothetical protein C9374_008814 [Naegleria lovaniensis]|uniref:Cytidyltransferase-like domain-containing protein n=1 Tax=Naegleria lovaniensis TaxID=51637 RepID=A0AA88KKE4_NAELO|nr:uncharacterized protein C9374_008814 [Naegleria lovaniensis]KAG2377729.1 hypothetical protein C9374_008814 [Naegleria lovaniensis]